MHIYVCSPHRAYGDGKRITHTVYGNKSFARQCCRALFAMGHTPVAPQLFYPQFTNEDNREERESCLAMAKADLLRCAAVCVFGDHVSDGMAAEIALAEEHGIPVHRFKTPGACDGLRGGVTPRKAPESEQIRMEEFVA